MKNLTLNEILRKATRVTESWQELKGPWTVEEQELKITEEDREFQYPTSPENEIEEFWDCFFARLTKLHIKEHSDEDIQRGFNKCMSKLEKRVRAAYNNSED